MDFYLTSVSSGDRLRIPLLPDRLNVKTGALTQSLTIIKRGEIKIPRGTSLTGYSWNSVFPSDALETASFVFDWQEPARIIEQITSWQENGETLRFLATELGINSDVFIESFTYEFYGVGDCAYTISLSLRRELSITTIPAPEPLVVQPEETSAGGSASSTKSGSASSTYGTVSTSGSALNIRKKASTDSAVIGKFSNGQKVEILGKTGNWYIVPCSAGTNGKGYCYASYIKTSSSGSGSTSKSGSKTSGTSSTGTTSYTVKAGDSLYSIAKAQLGDGTRYLDIYELNKSTLDKANAGSTSSKYTLPVGITISLPAKKTTATTAKSTSAQTTKSVVATASSVASKVTTAVSKVVTSKPVADLVNVIQTAANRIAATKSTTTTAAAGALAKKSAMAKDR